MIWKNLTIFISSDSKKGFFKEFRISANQIRYACIGGGVLFLFLCAFTVDYFSNFSASFSYQKYQLENQTLKTQLSKMHLKMEKLNTRLDQIEDFSHKVKVMAGLEQVTPSHLATGPLPSSSFPDVSSLVDKNKNHFRGPSSLTPVPKTSSTNLSAALSPSTLDSIAVYMNRLDRRSVLVQRDVNLMMEQLYEKKDIISSTPSILPAKGWISSYFGYRRYPFTGEVSLHEGIDIAAFPETPVYSPADGVVVFAGYKQGYGKVIVIDHGYELSTLYGHLADIMVIRWEKVKRGQVIGSIGNTGNSSGPHLHYEVRISNVPVDPTKYILDNL